MTVTVRLFAALRERAGGTAELALDLPDGATAADAASALAQRFPATASLLPRCAVAVNQAYAKPTTPLRHGDELAWIPPVSGG